MVHTKENDFRLKPLNFRVKELTPVVDLPMKFQNFDQTFLGCALIYGVLDWMNINSSWLN